MNFCGAERVLSGVFGEPFFFDGGGAEDGCTSLGVPEAGATWPVPAG
ncbi:MAG: hypothetical protein H6715_02550 [Myxococcales bacterium]|nr:hypothetical protein [Myxococcales bacterium]